VSAIKKQTFRERVRSVLKSVWYSPRFRAVAFAPVDALDRARGRDPLLPPRRLQYVGRREDFAPVGAYWRDRLVRDNGVGPDADVLDIGCGIGRAAVALIPQLQAGTYEGFDVVPQFVAWCSREITSRHPNFRFRMADVRNRQYNRHGDVAPSEYEFPFADRSFDAALAASVFTHLEPDGVRRYLREAERVLRPGGVLVSTFFLVDDAVAELLRGPRPAFSLDHRLTDAAGEPYLAADPRVPEFCVGIFEARLLEAAVDAGFEPGPGIERGWWSGREVPGDAPYQDVVTLRKPA
jgi:SAM-dependent methyltransferase